MWSDQFTINFELYRFSMSINDLMYTFFQHSESVFYFLVSNYTTTFEYNKNNELANWLVQLNRQL